MVRSFDGRPVDPVVVDRLLDAARRAPSAGFSQGVDLLVLDRPDAVARFWDAAFPDAAARGRFRWQGLFRAPVLVVPFADRHAYLRRYAEPDKASTGLSDPDRWPVPFWDVDAGMVVMLLLLGAVDAGLGALFFGIFARQPEVRAAFGVPADRRPVGVVAVGHPAPDEPGRSAARPRRPFHDVVHRNAW
jgi:nitroreductase